MINVDACPTAGRCEWILMRILITKLATSLATSHASYSPFSASMRYCDTHSHIHSGELWLCRCAAVGWHSNRKYNILTIPDKYFCSSFVFSNVVHDDVCPLLACFGTHRHRTMLSRNLCEFIMQFFGDRNLLVPRDPQKKTIR